MPDRFRTSISAIAFLLAAMALYAAIGLAQGTPPSAPAAQEPSAAREELNLGVTEYKAARYSEAITHFRRAADFAPTLPMARLYLATSLSQNVVPGLDTDENLRTADEALALFSGLVEGDPGDVNSMKQAAGLCFSVRQYDAARVWQRKVLAVDPHDAEAAYTIGVIDWTLAYQSLLSILAPVKVRDDGMGNLSAPAEAIRRFGSQNGALVAEAVASLNQAIADRPGYADAMAYLNLVYRLKASVDRDDEGARRADLQQAREWTDKGMKAHRALEASPFGATGPDASPAANQHD